MAMRLIILLDLLFSLAIPGIPVVMVASKDTISPGESLAGNDRLVSSNGNYALGFFQTAGGGGSNSSRHGGAPTWYLGTWLNRVPRVTPVWVANGDSPIADPATAALAVSPDDGNLVITVSNHVTKSIAWSSNAAVANATTTNSTTVVATLSDGGNLILRSSSSSSTNASHILWQSFDHPTNSLLPGAKIGRDKATGLNRRLVARKNTVDQAPGAYSLQLDPAGAAQFVLVELSSGVTYWTSGEWNGRFFHSIPDMGTGSEFVSNSREVYFTSPALQDETAIIKHLSLEVSGQLKSFLWYDGLQDWVIAATQPKSQCDVYATCGPFTVCDDGVLPCCGCMKGFSVRSPEDWELEDRTGGCARDTPLDCTDGNSNTSSDRFYSLPCVRLPHNAQNIVVATDEKECAKVCLSDCSCTAYSYGYDGCHVWHDELFNVKQQQFNDHGTAKVEFLHLRLAAKEVQNEENRGRTMFIWIFTGATLVLLVLVLLLMIWRKCSGPGSTLDNVQGGNGIIAFRYIDLQRATKNFSKRLGSGGFGSVYKGSLGDSNTIAVKMLHGVCQGEKQFRAEVSSIGNIQHINLARLIGFCSEGSRKLLVYEYMPNHSLDVHLFQSNTTLMLSWTTRYQIALGIARGLAYLHESCRDRIIHCDIKPQNILLDASFTPKIADFGMAKFMRRDLSRVLITVRGTVGYLAPEWISGVPITTKVDVYSYGLVLFEIISGRRNSCEGHTSQGHNAAYFPLHAAHNLLKGDIQNLVDHRLCGDANLEEVERSCKVACWCIQDADFDRPTMGEIVQVLEGVREFRVPPVPHLLQAVAGESASACTEIFFKAITSV